MKLKQIIEIVDRAYAEDGAITRAFAAETGSIDELLVGDSLAVLNVLVRMRKFPTRFSMISGGRPLGISCVPASARRWRC